jgi:hypothetical protein
MRPRALDNDSKDVTTNPLVFGISIGGARYILRGSGT